MSTSTIVLITLVGYKCLLLAVGFWASRRVKSESDFFIAGRGGEDSVGRGLGAFTAGLSYAASTSSAWVLLGFTGIVFSQGLVGLWLIPGIFGGYLMTWLVMGPRLNAETAAKGHITIVDFITDGFTDNWKRRIGILCALLILFCFVFYISSQFQAAGNALTEIFNIKAAEAICVGAAIIVIYCLMGGFWAASITDALQALVMMLACVIVPFAAVNAAGGIEVMMQTLKVTQTQSYFSFSGGAVGMATIGITMGLLGTGLGALGQPQLLNRIMAVKSQSERRKGAAITIGWGVVIYTGLVLLAFAGRALAIETGGESLFFAAAKLYLPAVLAGVVVAAVLSAVMSTVDSLLLAAASAVSHDMGIGYSSPQSALRAGRISMVAIAIFAVLMTLYLPQDIFSRVLFSWVALGAAFGPTILVKCLGWDVRGGYVFAAILTGFTLSVVFANIGGPVAGIIEKWASWAIGLLILFSGHSKEQVSAVRFLP